MSETVNTSQVTRHNEQPPCCAHAAAAHDGGGDAVRTDRRFVRGHAPPLWMEAAEVGAILVAAGGAHALAGVLGHRSYGAWLLAAIGTGLLAAALTGRRVLRRAHKG